MRRLDIHGYRWRKHKKAVAGGGIPAVLNDGNTKAWFDSAESYMTKDGSDFVSQWDDRSGNDNHLLQAVGTRQPLWSSDGVLLDGVDNVMKCNAFTLNQPEFIYMLIKQVSWAANDVLFDGNTLFQGIVQNSGTTPQMRAYAGTLSGVNGNLAVGSWGVLRVYFNGASSKFIVDDTTPVTGNFGANNMSGFTLGSRGDILSSFAHIQVKNIIIRTTDTGETDIYNYLASLR